LLPTHHLADSHRHQLRRRRPNLQPSLAIQLSPVERKRLRNPSCWRQRFPLKMARCEARKRF
jgi:hypothetical protein